MERQVHRAALLLTASLTAFSTTHTHRPPHTSPHANSNSSCTHTQRLRTLACNHNLSVSLSTCVYHTFTNLLPAPEIYHTANTTRGLAYPRPLLLTTSPRLREPSHSLVALARRPSENTQKATTKPAGQLKPAYRTVEPRKPTMPPSSPLTPT